MHKAIGAAAGIKPGNNHFFTNNDDFLQGVNGVYAQLKSVPDQFLWLGEMRSDNINAISDGSHDWDGINNLRDTKQGGLVHIKPGI